MGKKKFTVRGNVNLAATLIKGKSKIITADPEVVRRAAASLEGCAELLLDADEEMEVPVTLSVKELRHFVSYMRALDAVANRTREIDRRNAIVEQQLVQVALERDDMFTQLKEFKKKHAP